MAKFTVKWSASIEGENTIEAKSEEEARKLWAELPLVSDDKPDNFEIYDIEKVKD